MSAEIGQWGPVFNLPNVAIHTNVLPNGLVLMWGRRDDPDESLDVRHCTPFLWNPTTGEVSRTPKPTLPNGDTVNLFCAGHTFLPDGRLLVVGGHLHDSDGVNQACIYDSTTNTWTASARMNKGRWYPTAVTLPNGSVLVLSGSYWAFPFFTVVNDVLQIWKNGTWFPIIQPNGNLLNFKGLPLYPRMHVASDGRLFMSGSLAQSYFLNTANGGGWTPLVNPGGTRSNGMRDYCPSVMYDVDRVLYIGGGNDAHSHEPTAAVERIDLRENPPQWRAAQPMSFRRRQHNATVLPDGTVLVTGGTRGGGGDNNGFNDLDPGQPVHEAELWDPATGTWTTMASESVDRCSHATAVLLPDGRVLSAGGGEYRPNNIFPNHPDHSHRNAQVFSPPYLFKGPRPVISAIPVSITYGEQFAIATPNPAAIDRVSLVSLPSVTHSLDQNQRIVFLQKTAGASSLSVAAPDSANVCPPGVYMLFIVNVQGVPSVAEMVRVRPEVQLDLLGVAAMAEAEPQEAPVQVFEERAAVIAAARGRAATVGITGTCPYGLQACSGGALEALSHLEGVEGVDPIPDADNSTARVFLEDDRLPVLDHWITQFQAVVNGTYELRGVEVELEGEVRVLDGKLVLSTHDGSQVLLRPIEPGGKIQWNHAERKPRPLEQSEATAYDTLAAGIPRLPDGSLVRVLGPLKQRLDGYELQVRQFPVAESDPDESPEEPEPYGAML